MAGSVGVITVGMVYCVWVGVWCTVYGWECGSYNRGYGVGESVYDWGYGVVCMTGSMVCCV